MAGSQYQARYWSLLVRVRAHLYYFNHYAVHSEWWDKATGIFLAITSSGSIAAWALWREFTFLWPVLIAASQVVSAVKPFLPYKQRQKVVTEMGRKLLPICLAAEKDWFSVAEGILTEEEINDLLAKYRKQSEETEQNTQGDVVLPLKRKLFAEAQSDAGQYFKTNYLGG